MYPTVTYDTLTTKVNSNYIIVWVGSREDEELLIRLYNTITNTSSISSMSLSSIPDIPTTNIVEHNEATNGTKKFVGVTWQRRGWLRTLRIASIYGINIACKCMPGLDSSPQKVPDACIMGYDIETSQKYSRNGSFPPLNARITSLCVWCTCGYCKGWTTIKHKEVQSLIYCGSSSTLVSKFLEDTADHMPLWLVGYNSYQFDNSVLAYHAPTKYESWFRNINSGSKAAANYSYYIDIIGVNNVDLYSYLDKQLRGKYTALSLGYVAEHHNMGSKLTMPTTYDTETVYELIKYNINDSLMTAKLWTATGVHNQVVGLCAASCSPIVDCVRYVSGTMASCAASSYCISKGMVMDWSECNLRIGYEGGIVLDPIRKLFKFITVVDFSSMYPTIIRDVGISPENIEVLGSCSGIHEDKLLDYCDGYTMVCIKGKIVKYNRHSKCMSRDVLTATMGQRAKYKKTDPDFALGFKILSNSLYGAFGFASSPMHSPRCAATVTVLGRTATALASVVFNGLGLVVGYGDTDSCMLAEGKYTQQYFQGNVVTHIDAALDIFHRIIEYTPFPSMRMEREETYDSMLLVDKKHYAYKEKSGKIKTKGLSSTRKDRLGLCRHMTMMVAEQILDSEDIEITRPIICNLLNKCYEYILSGSLDIQAISREVRHEGNTCYRYTDDAGKDINTPVAKVNLLSKVNYDKQKICKSLEADMNKLCVPAGLGTVYSMLLDADL